MSDSFQFTEQHTKESKTNFYYSFFFLPKEKRQAIYTVYSFCRETDDIVDSATDVNEARKRLNEWRLEIDNCFNHEPSHPITKALYQVIKTFPMPAEYFHKLVDGCEMDLMKTRYATFDELEKYCYHVASVVGLICIEIFGYRSPQTKEYAVNLGMALQLTNIIRDVAEDAGRGRIYIPQNEFERFGYSEELLLKHKYNPAYVQLMEHQARRASAYYDKAVKLHRKEDNDLLFPAEIMREIYYRLFEQIREMRYDVFRHRARIPNSVKFRIALKLWFASRFRKAPQ